MGSTEREAEFPETDSNFSPDGLAAERRQQRALDRLRQLDEQWDSMLEQIEIGGEIPGQKPLGKSRFHQSEIREAMEKYKHLSQEKLEHLLANCTPGTLEHVALNELAARWIS